MAEKQKAKQTWTLARALPYILIIGGAIGFFASFMLTYDKIQILQNPHFIPNCNLNPVVSCGSVMQSRQGSTFGFPNSFIGLGAFAVLITIGAAMLAGGKFKRWFWLGLETGVVLGLLFAFWLLYISLFTIRALCPYCLSVDVVVITTFWYVTLYNIDAGHLRLPKRGKAAAAYAWIRRHHFDLLVLWFLILIFIILKHFWYYYGRYF